jgi:peptide/nickel transport system substrate-binding protein
VLERPSLNYWNKGRASISSGNHEILHIVDSHGAASRTCARVQLDFIERMAASDVPGKKRQPLQDLQDRPRSATRASRSTSARATSRRRIPLGKDPRVREAFELALDRDGIVQVAMDGEASRQPVGRAEQPFYAKNVPIPKRDVARAKALLARPACRIRASR